MNGPSATAKLRHRLETRRQNRLKTRAAPFGVIVLLAAMAVYLNALPNGFTYDDIPIILENAATQPTAPWWEPWARPYWPGTNEGDELDVLYRPFTVQTYALERRLFGTWAMPPHLLNMVLHAAVSVGVFWLTKRLGCRTVVATAAGLIFAVHPVHVEAVANVVGRAELLSTGGILLALWLTDLWCASTHVRSKSPALALGVLLAALVAMTSKESGVAVVVLVPAWCAWRRCSLRGLAALATTLMVLLTAYLLVRYEVCGGRLTIGGQRVGPGNPLREAATVERLLTPVSLLGRYLVLMVWPTRLLCDYSADVIRLTRTVADGYFLVGLTLIATLLAGAVASIRRGLAGLFAVVGFVGAYVLASNTLLLIDVIFAERIFYGPSVWICVGFGLMLERAYRRGRRAQWIGEGRRRTTTIAGVCFIVLMIGFAAHTVQRNPVWRDNATLFRGDLAAMDPGRRSAHLCFTVARLDAGQGNFAQAERLLREAIGIHRDYPEYYQQLGEVYLETGRFEEAVGALERAHLLQRHNMETVALLDRARQRAAGVDVQGQLAAARKAAGARPDDVATIRRWAALARVGAGTVDAQEAVEAHRRWALLAPDDPTALKDFALALAAAGEPGEAARKFRQVLQRWPADWEAHTNLALLLMGGRQRPSLRYPDIDRYDPKEALEHARRAVELNPTHWQVQVNAAEVTAHCGDPLEAARLFEQLADQCPEGSTERRLYRDRARYLRHR